MLLLRFRRMRLCESGARRRRCAVGNGSGTRAAIRRATGSVEKLDGVRARCGTASACAVAAEGRLPRPPGLSRHCRGAALDGELWFDGGASRRSRQSFANSCRAMRKWRPVRYMVFELPGASGFSARLARIAELVAVADVEWLSAVPQFRVADAPALTAVCAKWWRPAARA